MRRLVPISLRDLTACPIRRYLCLVRMGCVGRRIFKWAPSMR